MAIAFLHCIYLILLILYSIKLIDCSQCHALDHEANPHLSSIIFPIL